MAVGIGAGGYIGIALETVAGTYVAPTKFFPIRSETLQWRQETNWREEIRGVADVIGAVPGNGHIEGDISYVVMSDVLPYFLRASRVTTLKSGAGPYTYVTTPSHAAQAPDKTMSITVVRNGVVFGYVGCVVSSSEYSQENGLAVVTHSMLGNSEASQTLPTPTFSTGTPFGAGKWSIQIPTATQVFDVSNFTFSVEDNGEVQTRLQNVLGAAFIKYGARRVTVHVDRDFHNRTEYDAFKALTASSVTVAMSNGVGDSVTLKTAATIRDTYDLAGLTGQGELIGAGIDWVAIYDTVSSKSYEITVVTAENIV